MVPLIDSELCWAKPPAANVSSRATESNLDAKPFIKAPGEWHQPVCWILITTSCLQCVLFGAKRFQNIIAAFRNLLFTRDLRGLVSISAFWVGKRYHDRSRPGQLFSFF